MSLGYISYHIDHASQQIKMLPLNSNFDVVMASKKEYHDPDNTADIMMQTDIIPERI